MIWVYIAIALIIVALIAYLLMSKKKEEEAGEGSSMNSEARMEEAVPQAPSEDVLGEAPAPEMPPSSEVLNEGPKMEVVEDRPSSAEGSGEAMPEVELPVEEEKKEGM